MADSVHSGHRKRLKESMLQNEFSGIQNHVLLETLLFYSVPVCDTNETAHKLIDTFGSFNAVFEADYHDLMSVDGIGENSAFLIKLINSINKVNVAPNKQSQAIIKSVNDAAELLLPNFIGEKDEKMMVIFLDNSNRVITLKEVARGHVNGVNIDKRKLLEQAVRCNASGIILAHNHPHGVAAPSKADINLTSSIASLMKNIDINLVDHLIFNDDEYCTLKGRDKGNKIFF